MAAKEVKFGGDGRQRMLRGVDILVDAKPRRCLPRQSCVKAPRPSPLV
jgi:hypothetical protein